MIQRKPSLQPLSPETGASPQTVIGQEIHIQGDLRGNSKVELRGTIEGNVRLKGDLVVGEGGRVTGDISAASVIVEGEVNGDIHAMEKVHLANNSKTKGNLRANCLSIQEGALFEGRVSELPGHEVAEPVPGLHEAPVYQ